MVPKAGLEPARIATVDFESTASTDFATSAQKVGKPSDYTCQADWCKRYAGYLVLDGEKISNSRCFCLCHHAVIPQAVFCRYNNSRLRCYSVRLFYWLCLPGLPQAVPESFIYRVCTPVLLCCLCADGLQRIAVRR